jgi:hypothetical protein
VLRIFIALKNPSPWPGSNPQPSGLVASTLTTSPPRGLASWRLKYVTSRIHLHSDLSLVTLRLFSTTPWAVESIGWMTVNGEFFNGLKESGLDTSVYNHDKFQSG